MGMGDNSGKLSTAEIKSIASEELAEMAVIGIALLKPEAQKTIFETVSYSMFSNVALANLFGMMQAMYENGDVADQVSMISKLDPSYKELIIKCAETPESISGLGTYMKCVFENYRKRTMRETAKKIAIDYEISADEMFNDLQTEMIRQEHIIEREKRESAVLFKDGLSEFNEWMDRPNESIYVGISAFDSLSGGFQKNSVIVIAARSGWGKSTLAFQIAAHISRERSVIYHSLEMPREQVYTAIFSRVCNIDSKKITQKTLTDEEKQSILQAESILSDGYDLVIDDSPMQQISDIDAVVKERVPDVVFIDHLGLVTPDKSKQKRNEELVDMTRALKKIAMKYGIIIVELVQASRKADVSKISMSDMFGSSSIEQDADMIIAINHGDESQMEEQAFEVDVDIIKNRQGSCGSIPFLFRKPYHEFVAIDDRY
jgi:replicative DNA helicase